MVNKSHPAESGVRSQRLWQHIGRRLQTRRVEKGLTEAAVAAHLGIPLAVYQSFEGGQAKTPAAQLAELADLFKVPLFYFFRDLPFGEFQPRDPPSEPAPVFRVATDEDRMVALITDFCELDRERQQYLLLFARALVEHMRSE
jgi:transcriptional regulator with XRE-family HTH domain